MPDPVAVSGGEFSEAVVNEDEIVAGAVHFPEINFHMNRKEFYCQKKGRGDGSPAFLKKSFIKKVK
jgi:hypothetical protein